MAALASALGGAQAQPPKAPDYAAIVEKVCLPLMRGGPVEQAAAGARQMAFAQTARNATMITLERPDSLSLTVGGGAAPSCYLTMEAATPAHFDAVEPVLRRWLPRLGRYWAGKIETGRDGTRYAKYRAGGFTVALEVQRDEHSRRLNLTMTK